MINLLARTAYRPWMLIVFTILFVVIMAVVVISDEWYAYKQRRGDKWIDDMEKDMRRRAGGWNDVWGDDDIPRRKYDNDGH